MSDTQQSIEWSSITWSSMELPGKKHQYTTTTSLDRGKALQMQTEIINELGTAHEGHTNKHKKFPCRAYQLGGTYKVDVIVDTPDQFLQACPGSVVTDQDHNKLRRL